MEHGTPRLRARAHRPRNAAAAAAQVKAPTAAVRQCAAAIVTDMPQLENSERLSTVLKRTYCNHFGVDYDTQRQVLDYWVRKLRCNTAQLAVHSMRLNHMPPPTTATHSHHGTP